MNKFTKYTVIVAAVALIGASQARAITVSWAALNTRFMTLSDTSTPLPVGDFIAIGVLNGSEAATAAQGTNSSAAVAGTMSFWVTGTIGDGGPEGAFSISTLSPGGTFLGKQIYLFAVNGTTANGQSQVGVYSNPSWKFPASDGSGPVGIDVSDVGTYAVIGSLATGTVGDPNLGAPPNVDAAALHLIAPVPEPSTIVLVGFGLLSMLGLARRRS